MPELELELPLTGLGLAGLRLAGPRLLGLLRSVA